MSASITASEPLRPGLWNHMRRLWPRWTLLPSLPFVLWCIYCLGRGEKRWELVVLMFAIPALAYWNDTTKKLFVGMLPIGLVGLLYDGMRFTKNVGLTPESVHVLDLRAHEIALFGVQLADGTRGTLHDWFQAHHATWADLYFALPYGTFLYVPLIYSVVLYRADFRALQRYTWAFFLVNVAGFLTYHLYPAAPPWYFHAHGGHVDLAAYASTGVPLSRVDAYLGVPYFARLYGRSNDVFGAVPSLHVAYPLLMVIEVWRHHGKAARTFAISFWLSTCVAAVYLDHHWVIDVVVGLIYTVVIYLAMNRAMPTLKVRAPTAA
ncbi:MAG: phosphatase PAP2 family protein [Polyangiales bacterium]